MTTAVRAAAHLEAVSAAGATSLVSLRSDPPLVLRRTAPGRVHLVSVGAGPLGGDDLALRIRLGPGARLQVVQVAASVALPGPDGAGSRVRYEVELGEHADLRFDGEPIVAAAGCNHSSELHVTAAPSAALRWRDEVVAGRHGEASGRVRSRVTVVRGGQTVLRTDVCVGDAHWGSPAVGGGARVAAVTLLVGPPAARVAPVTGEQVAVLRATDALAVVTALGDAHPDVRALLASAGG